MATVDHTPRRNHGTQLNVEVVDWDGRVPRRRAGCGRTAGADISCRGQDEAPAASAHPHHQHDGRSGHHHHDGEPPRLVTTNFVCSNGSCAIGPGDTGMAFEAGLIGTGGPVYYGPESAELLSHDGVEGGALPPGLQLGEPICEWEITGAPTVVGTWSFTVRITPQPNNLGQQTGAGRLSAASSITIGSGTADRLFVSAACGSSARSTSS